MSSLNESPLSSTAPSGPVLPDTPGAAGRQAVSNGKEFEQDVRSRLLRRAYSEQRILPEAPTEPFFVYQWRSPFHSPTGTRMVPDFYIWHPAKHPEGRLIEVKSQEKPGSTDAKLFVTVHMLRETGIPAILVLIGQGFSKPWREWCKRQDSDRLMVIGSTDDWYSRLNRGLF